MTDTHLVWIDCEMTGLDLTRDRLVEVAVLVTDSELNVLGDGAGLDVVIATPPEALEAMEQVVVDMHTASGLLEELRTATTTLEEAQQQVLDYVRQWVPERRRAPLCGNSIATDRGFLARDMPALDDHLHYRMVDVSSVKELARRWYPRAYFNAPAKTGNHRALGDIHDSVRELRYYRSAVFVPAPGPDSPTAQRLAAEVSGTGEAGPAGAGATPYDGTAAG